MGRILFVHWLCFLVVPLFGQTDAQYGRMEIKEQITPLETYINDAPVKNNDVKQVYTYIYLYNLKKDTIFFYNLNQENSNTSATVVFTLSHTIYPQNLKLFIAENNETIDSLLITFDDEHNSICINQADKYELNTGYYQTLKKNIEQGKNIADLLGLLDDKLGDYPYQLEYLRGIRSLAKYNSKNNFRIKSASIITKRLQADDYIDKWKVNYKYNTKNVLIEVEQKSKEEMRFSKKLLSYKNDIYSFKTIRNVESRFEDTDTTTFDLKGRIYSTKQSHFVFAQIKEANSILRRLSYKISAASSLKL